jgi:hypothetical protein
MGPGLPWPLVLLPGCGRVQAYDLSRVLVLMLQAVTGLPGLLILGYAAWLAVAEERWYGTCWQRMDTSNHVFPKWAYQVGGLGSG